MKNKERLTKLICLKKLNLLLCMDEVKIRVFKEKTGLKKQIFFAMILANRLEQSMYSEELVSGIASLKDLYQAF